VRNREETKCEIQELAEILDVRGAAKFLHCSPSHVSNILNRKVPNLPPIPHVHAGRLRLIRKDALVEWFKAQEAASLQAAASPEAVPQC
jgi:hypothetical protein